MLHPLDGPGVGGQEDLLRLASEGLDQPLEVRLDRGREQQHLHALGHVLQDVAHVLQEAHRQHLVRLVEAGHLALREIHVAAPDVVQHTPGGAHDDLGAVPQGVRLGPQPHAAVDRDHADVLVGRQLLGLRGHLQRQLPGGGQHDPPHLPRAVLDPLQDRDGEGRGLARAGLAADQQVVAGQQLGDRLGLDLGRTGVLHLGQGLQEGLGQAQGGPVDGAVEDLAGLGDLGLVRRVSAFVGSGGGKMLVYVAHVCAPAFTEMGSGRVGISHRIR